MFLFSKGRGKACTTLILGSGELGLSPGVNIPLQNGNYGLKRGFLSRNQMKN